MFYFSRILFLGGLMFLNMAHLLTSRSHSVIDGYDLIWATLDSDAKVCFSEEKPKKLLDICAEKLITDVLLVERYCFKLPKSIHLLIFSKAIAKSKFFVSSNIYVSNYFSGGP